jgi:hypothetical protein
MRSQNLFPVLMLALLTSCSGISPGVRETNANRLALPVFMIPRTVTAEPFKLKAYERVHTKNTNAVVYIEDSGNVMVDGTRFEADPTPKYPVALSLASQDSSTNVIYLGRPCQYRMGMVDAKAECPSTYLTTHMFAPDVLQAYDTALNDLKARYQITGFNLVGAGSGGGLATILAAARKDVLTLRTVAGLLDTQTYARAHKLSGFDASYNPIDSVPDLMNMPQHHYVAQFDDVVPNAVYHSYAQAFGNDRCLGYTFVQNVDHTYDWSSNWTAFAKDPVTCAGPNPDDAERARRQAVYTPQMEPKK